MFLFGKGTDVPTYDALKRKREIIDALQKQSLGMNANSVPAGMMQLGQAILARYADSKLAPKEADAKQKAFDSLTQIRSALGPQGITEGQFGDLSQVASNPYADPMVEAIAKSLMRRNVTPSETGGFTGGGLGDLMTMSSMNTPQQPVNGGPMDGVMPQEIPPEEGGPMPFGMPDGPMSGTGEEAMRYSPQGLDVAGDIKLTEGQSKDLGFWNRMDGVNADIDANAEELTSGGERLKNSVPMVGNALVSEGFQRGRRAAEEWLWGLLRKDTGAAITKQEYDLYGPTYIPQYGDKPGTIRDKAAARQRAMDGIKKGLGIAEILAEELGAQRQKAAPPTDGDWRTQDPSTWTDEQLKEYVGG